MSDIDDGGPDRSPYLRDADGKVVPGTYYRRQGPKSPWTKAERAS